MKRITFILAALTLMACQQNTQKSSPSGEGENTSADAPQQQDQTQAPENDWSKLKLKGKVKTITEIISNGIEKNGQIVKDESDEYQPLIKRTSFNQQGFITLTEKFNSLPMVDPFEIEKYFYNEKGQLAEIIRSEKKKEVAKTSFSYNEQGDRTLERLQLSDIDHPIDTETHYEYTSEGKQKISSEIRGANSEKIKIVSHYNNENVLVKKEEFDEKGTRISENIYTYNEKGLLVKELDNNDGSFMSFKYDTYGNITSIISKSEGESETQTYKYQYDKQGNIVKEEFQLLNEEEDYMNYSYTKNYTYDAQGNKISESCQMESLYKSETIFTEYHIEYY